MNELEELQENSNKPIGTIFEYEGVKLRIEEHVDSYNCEGCYFNRDDETCYTLRCASFERGETEVFYKEI